MIALILASLKGFQISWKAVIAGVLALAVVLAIHSAKNYVEDLQAKAILAQARIEMLQGALNLARVERDIAEARSQALEQAQAELAARLNAFNTERLDSETRLSDLRRQLDNLNLDKEMTDDGKLARDRLNARVRSLNRLLEAATRF